MKASSNKYIQTTWVALFDVDTGFESRYSNTRVLTDSPEPVSDLKYLIKKVSCVLQYKNYFKIYGHVKNHGVEKGLNVSEMQLRLRLRFLVYILPLLDCFAFVKQQIPSLLS